MLLSSSGNFSTCDGSVLPGGVLLCIMYAVEIIRLRLLTQSERQPSRAWCFVIVLRLRRWHSRKAIFFNVEIEDSSNCFYQVSAQCPKNLPSFRNTVDPFPSAITRLTRQPKDSRKEALVYGKFNQNNLFLVSMTGSFLMATIDVVTFICTVNTISCNIHSSIKATYNEYRKTGLSKNYWQAYSATW